MASPNPDIVEHASEQSPAYEKESAVHYREKGADTVVELQETPPSRHHAGHWARSFRDACSKQSIRKYATAMVKFGKFVGPASIISVAYVDPDNFQTSISSGVQFKYKLLFMVLVSNLIAIFLQVCGDCSSFYYQY